MEQKIDNLTAMVETLTHHRTGDRDDAPVFGMPQREEEDEAEDSLVFGWSDTEDEDDNKGDDKKSDGGNDGDGKSGKGDAWEDVGE